MGKVACLPVGSNNNNKKEEEEYRTLEKAPFRTSVSRKSSLQDRGFGTIISMA